MSSRAARFTIDTSVLKPTAILRTAAEAGTVVGLTHRMLNDLSDELGGMEPAIEWLIELATLTGRPVAVNMPTPTGSTTSSGTGDAAAQELHQIAADHENRPQGQVYAILFDLTDGGDDPGLKTDSGSNTWHAEDILGLYRDRVSAWPGAVLQERTEGDKRAWRLTVSNPQWRTAAEAQKWCDASFAQYDGAARTSRCRVPQG